MYAPVLDNHSDIDIAGFWNRDEVKGQKLTDAFGYKRYRELDKLANDSDALIIAVNSAALTDVTSVCIGHRKPILAETPVWTKQVVEAATRANVSLAIAEQTPYLPSEQFKMELLKRVEVFGTPHTVVNDFRTFEYHGLAQLRRYIGYHKEPVEICGMSHAAPMVPFLDGNNVEQRGHTENWESGQVRFATGELAIYNFSSLYNRCRYRRPRSLRIYTDRATISNDDDDFTVSFGTEDTKGVIGHHSLRVTRNSGMHNVSPKTRRLESSLPSGEVVSWDAPTKHLTDQQEALKVIVDNFAKHVIDGDMLLYDAAQGWTDFNLLNGIRRSGSSKRYISR